MTHRCTRLIARVLLAQPWHSLLLFLAVILIVGALIPGLRLVAPADNLLQADSSAGTSAEPESPAAESYGLTVTCEPLDDDVLSESALALLAELRDALAAVPGVAGVDTLLEAPLLFSPPVSFADVAGRLEHVQDTGVDTDLARQEFQRNPLYRQRLLAADGRQTALHLRLAPGAAQDLLRGEGSLRRELEAVLEPRRARAALFLGGAPLLASGMPAALLGDCVRLCVPALGAMFLVLLLLWRRPLWAVVPPLAGGAGAILLLGVLACSGRALGVVPAYAVFFTLLSGAAASLRLVERFRALGAERPGSSPRELADATLCELLPPTLSVGGTVMLGCAAGAFFASGPVAQLGAIALSGVPLALLSALIVAPTLLAAGSAPRTADGSLLDGLSRRFGATVLLLALALLAAGSAGIIELRLEDRLLGRFAPASAFAQGMERIDREFGGLTPLAIVLDAGAATAAGAGSENPWYSSQGIARVAEVQDLIARQPEVASVRSLALFGAAAAELAGAQVDDEQLAAALRDMPAERRALLIDPWLPAARQTMLAVGLRDSGDGIGRGDAMPRISSLLVKQLGIPAGQVHIDASLLPRDGALGSLLRVQALAVAAVCLAVAALAFAWLRSPLQALLAPLPVLLAAVVVLGAMGWAGVPLGSISTAFPLLAACAAAANCLHYLWQSRPGDGRGTSGALRSMCYIALAGGAALAVLLAAEFLPNRQLALCGGAGLWLAAFGGGLLLPRLLEPLRDAPAGRTVAVGELDSGEGLGRA